MTAPAPPTECRLINDPKGVTTCATHHALFPEPCTESFLELADARLAAKDARIRELVGILWQIATDPLQDHHIREAVSAALARSEGGSCRRSSEIRAVAAQSRR